MKINLKKNFLDIIVIIIIAAEVVALLNYLFIGIKNNDIQMPYSTPAYSFEKIYAEEIRDLKKYPFGKKYGTEYKKPPVLIFGDSAAYGEELEEEQRFSYLLSKYIHKPVYNRAFGGWGPQNIYWQFKNEDFYKEISQEPEAIIIVYSPFCFKRMYSPDLANGLKYNIKDGKIIRVSSLYNKLNLSYFILKVNSVAGEIKGKDFDKSFDDFKVYILESYKESKKHWKNTKFYIIKYLYKDCPENPERWKELEAEGIKIFEFSDFLGQNYFLKDEYIQSFEDFHPTEKFWKDAVPKIAEKLNL